MRYFLFFMLLSYKIALSSQNLVIDGSFEQCTPDFQCDWQVIVQSPDLFVKDLGASKNKGFARLGNHARTGENYLGMFMGYKSEFVLGTLKIPLQAGKEYNIGMYTHLSPLTVSCEKKFSVLSIWFTDTIPKFIMREDWGIDSHYIPLKGKNKYLSNTEDWELVSGNYKAKGGEKYILIGNFKGANLDVTKNCRTQYYFMDDVFVNEKQIYLENPTIGKTIELKDIFFESAKWDLLPLSFSALNDLVTILEMNPTWSIEIRGHTDNIGNKDVNLDLSMKRARAIYEYLINKGIASRRLNFKGFGESQPIASNTSEEGRTKNRRVEFIITQIGMNKK